MASSTAPDLRSVQTDSQRDSLQSATPPWKPVVMQAKVRTPCSQCHLSISPGNAIYPWVCKHWSRRGYCLYKEKCFYRHPPEALPCKATATSNQAATNSSTNAAQRKSNRGIGKRNLVRNAFRASVFRRFLIDTFGRELLGSGSGVLDVAGGKGELSYELVNLNGIASTVVEPRALQLWRQHKWMLKGYYHRNTNFQTYVDVPHKAFVSGEHTTVDPPHLRMVFDAAVVNSLLPPASQHSASLPQQPAVAARNNTLIPQAEGLLAKDAEETSIQAPAEAQAARCDASTPHLLGEQTQLVDEPGAENSVGCNVGLHIPADLSQCSGAAQAVLATSTAESSQALDEPQSAVRAADGQSQNIHDNHNQPRLSYTAQQEPVETELCAKSPHWRCGSAAGLPDPTDSNGHQELKTRAAEWDSVLKHSMQLAKNIKWTHKGLQHEHEDGATWSDTEPAEVIAAETAADPTEDQALQSQEELRDGPTDITDTQQAWNTIQHCSVIVGMHPDQAAEPIIDFAQRTRRPFAMVPCCVYPAEFPHRRLPDGTWVRKYEQLIEYLQSKSLHIKVATLPFEGRNQVVYCTSWSDSR